MKVPQGRGGGNSAIDLHPAAIGGLRCLFGGSGAAFPSSLNMNQLQITKREGDELSWPKSGTTNNAAILANVWPTLHWNITVGGGGDFSYQNRGCAYKSKHPTPISVCCGLLIAFRDRDPTEKREL